MSVKNLRLTSFIFFLFLVSTTTALDGMIHTAFFPVMMLSVPLVFTIIISLLILGDKLNTFTPFHICLFAYLLWSSASYIWTTTPGDTAWKLFLFNIYFMILSVIFWYSLTSKEKLYQALYSFMMTIFLLSLVMINNYNSGIEADSISGGGRYTAFDIGTNEMGTTVAIGLLIAIFLISVTKSNFVKITTAITIPTFAFSVFLTGSRTGSIVLFASLVLVAYIFMQVEKKGKILIIIAVFIAMNSISSFAPGELIDRIFSSKESVSSGNLNERGTVWKIAIKGWKEQPIVGRGIDSFKQMSNNSHIDLEAHNTYLSILVEYGAIGFIIYLSIISLLFFYIFQLQGIHRIFLFTLMLQILLAQMTTNMQDNSILWALYLIIMSYYWIISGENKVNNRVKL